MVQQQRRETAHKAKVGLPQKTVLRWRRVGVSYAKAIVLNSGLMFWSGHGMPETGLVFAQEPASKEVPPARSGELDPAVKLLLGNTLDYYQKFGYKEVELGTSFEAVDKQTPLNWTVPDMPHLMSNSERFKDGFIFNQDRKMVCYTRSYDGGPDDYLDKLIEVFGKTDKEIKKLTTDDGDGFNSRSFVAYTFPRVLVRIVFSKTGWVVLNHVQTKETTYVYVIDREWAVGVLEKIAAGRRKNLAWLKKLTACVRDGDLKLDCVPALAGAAVKMDTGGAVKMSFADEETGKQNEGRKREEQANAVVAGILIKPQFPDEDGRRIVVQINFNFNRYAPNKAGEIMNHPKAKPSPIATAAGANALEFTPFADLVTELNSTLVQEYFPPKTDKIQIVRPKFGPASYQWQTEDHWKVIYGFNGLLTLDKLEEKGL